MNTQKFLQLVTEGYVLDVVGTKIVKEGDKENPVEQEHVDAYLVSPFEVPDMMQNEDKNLPVQRRKLDGTGLTVPLRLPVPHVTLAAIDPDLIDDLKHKYEQKQRQAEQKQQQDAA